MRLLTAAQMRAADERAAQRVGETELMGRAGEAIAEGIRRYADRPTRIVAFAGPGNNGGDAFAALALLEPTMQRFVYAAPTTKVTEARRDAEERAANSGVVTLPLPESPAELRRAADGADLLIDGLLGTGARAAPTAPLAAAIDALNAAAAPVLAIDVPSGLDATSGAAAVSSVRAWLTVTLGAVKIGLVLDPARSYAGTICLGDLGMLVAEIDGVEGERYAALDDTEFLALLPRRGASADKRSAGAPLIVAGSPQFPGAAVLCALGAARSGAGYVTVATPDSVAPALRGHLIEQVVMTFGEADAAHSVDELVDLTNHCSAVGMGPGLGLREVTGEVVRGFVQRLELPFVADASALFHFAKRLDVLSGKACVLTPHEGEFARLSGKGTVAPGTRVARLRAFVARTGIVTLLKGRSTLIDDGTTVHVNLTGTPALATAGTGDVLTGIIATLLSQGLSPVDAARAGAYWHGLAGRAAAFQRPVGVIAHDVADALGRAVPPHRPPERLPLRIIAT
ncbi:MAG: NAD(P)H-hydrate dehydratase [Candidatus Eremiobacteraeota bacterium]|nr:NAD(P)H-hydrate dehydratase [Candidatus Eremiobacteraeota bacterium]